MISKDDDFPYHSDDPELQPLDAQWVDLTSDQQEEQEIRILLRFLLGSAIEGSDEFWRRARLWQIEQDKARSAGMLISPASETETKRLRYALIGFFFQALDGGSERLKSLQQSSESVYQTFSHLVDPLVSSRLMRPLRNTVDRVVSKGESVLESWVQTGRREEQLSRSLVRDQAYEDLVDAVLDYVAQKPEVRDLIQDQSVGMVGEVVGELRARSTDVDSYMANQADAIFRRRRKEAQPTQPAQPE